MHTKTSKINVAGIKNILRLLHELSLAKFLGVASIGETIFSVLFSASRCLGKHFLEIKLIV